MKKEVDPKILYGAVALIVIVFVVLFIRMTGDTTVPASAIKSPPPPGGFPGTLPPSADGQASGNPSIPPPTE